MKKLQYVLLGCLLTSLGLLTLRHAHLVTGGTAGLALTLSYFLHLPFANLFFILNLPFYIFSFLKMGWKFTVSTICAVTLLTLLTAIDQWLPTLSLPPLIGAIVGGILLGLGVTILFMNKSSLGGINILVMYLQKRYNLDPGKTTFFFDFSIVVLSFFSIGITRELYSVLSIAVSSTVISYYKNRLSFANQAKPYSLSFNIVKD